MTTTYTSLHEHQLGNLQFHSASKTDLVSIINEQLDCNGCGLCIGYVNPHVYNVSQTDVSVTAFLNQCDLVCIDGLGTSLVLKATYGPFSGTPVHRVVALTLFDALIKQLTTPANAVLIGVDAADVQLSARNINALNSNFTIVDCIDGFQAESDYTHFLEQHPLINWVLIGAGSPKSEHIAMLARKQCPNAIVFHMGAGTIKVYAGTKRRAPAWVSTVGLEWAHRMLFEPHTRSRYTRGGWQFLRHLLPTLIRKHSKSAS